MTDASQPALTKQLAPLIIFLAVIILCTLVISNRRSAKKNETPPAEAAPQLRMELSPFQYSADIPVNREHREQSAVPGVESTLHRAAEFCYAGDFDKAEDILQEDEEVRFGKRNIK